MSWVLFFVMITSDGEFVNRGIGSYATVDECFYAMDEYVAQLPDEEPYNWDFVCLQDPGYKA